jgi:sec-independent protein translocase protein TatA
MENRNAYGRPAPMFAEIFGPDVLIVLAVIALLFGGSQLPKLARSLGSAQNEFKKGLQEGGKDKDKDKDSAKDGEPEAKGNAT